MSASSVTVRGTTDERGWPMSRARRARKIAATAAYGGGGLAAGIGALGAIGYGVLKVEAKVARRIVGQPFDGSPDDNGLYGAGVGEPVELVVLGDSSAAGMGADHRYQTVGAIIANGVSALTGRPVRLTNTAVVGAESSGLELQLANALDQVPRPHVAIIMIGANDVTHRINKAVAVRHLETTVRALRALDTEVVVGTCPDLGTIQPIPQPLRLIGRRWSRDMAAAQTVAVVEAGGRTVSLGDLLGPEFAERPHEMFSADRFHPSPAGYARAAAALLPSVYDALGVRIGEPSEERHPDARHVGPVPAGGLGTAPVEVLDQRRVELGDLGQGRGDHLHRQVVGADLLERALERAPDGRAGGRDDDGFGHGFLLMQQARGREISGRLVSLDGMPCGWVRACGVALADLVRRLEHGDAGR